MVCLLPPLNLKFLVDLEHCDVRRGRPLPWTAACEIHAADARVGWNVRNGIGICRRQGRSAT